MSRNPRIDNRRSLHIISPQAQFNKYKVKKQHVNDTKNAIFSISDAITDYFCGSLSK